MASASGSVKRSLAETSAGATGGKGAKGDDDKSLSDHSKKQKIEEVPPPAVDSGQSKKDKKKKKKKKKTKTKKNKPSLPKPNALLGTRGVPDFLKQTVTETKAEQVVAKFENRMKQYNEEAEKMEILRQRAEAKAAQEQEEKRERKIRQEENWRRKQQRAPPPKVKTNVDGQPSIFKYH